MQSFPQQLPNAASKPKKKKTAQPPAAQGVFAHGAGVQDFGQAPLQ
jgi:hypothetical protein